MKSLLCPKCGDKADLILRINESGFLHDPRRSWICGSCDLQFRTVYFDDGQLGIISDEDYERIEQAFRDMFRGVD